ncbi:hypothetical protein Patl1_23863 [Pistacia atlantica]|uniref:Uncharacterized protein n=1 Tax=Pistacia atlantica TaxID=434234 RepID=A0ACC0ZZS8_9ROSI|nr:hypothetical protein Patl1_23863 [Pistacia atlantica]
MVSYSMFDLFRQTKIHNIGATLVGVDKFGNKYYEKYGDTQHAMLFYYMKEIDY